MTANFDYCIRERIRAAHRRVVYSVEARCQFCRFYSRPMVCDLVKWRKS